MVISSSHNSVITPVADSAPRLNRASLEKVAAIFAAFADATRLAILQELKKGRLSVGELVASLGTSQANISKHLKLLHQAGLLVREREGMQVFYKVSEESVYEMCNFACHRLNQNSQSTAADGEYFI